MANNVEQTKERDVKKNWVYTSTFIFYVQVFCILGLVFGSCYKLYEKRYKGTPKVEVPENTKYTPKYK
jgi:hypothetical protein